MRLVLRTVREGLAVWKNMPQSVFACIAGILRLLEAEGQWPHEMVSALVAMIPLFLADLKRDISG